MDACGAWNEVASPSGRHSALAHARPRPRPPARQPNRRFVAARAVKSPKRLKYSGVGTTAGKEPTVVSIDAANYTPSDAWRLQPAIEALQKGAVGIIPTDTLPAIVCDLASRNAVPRLYASKDMDPKKPLSILCSSLSEVAEYTTGFPVSNRPGQPNWFNVARKILPGPYTIILPASKAMPSQVVDYTRGRTVHRKSVGVRLPDDPVCRALLEGLGRPLLCTSVHVAEVLSDDTEVPDLGTMLDMYGGKGTIDFIIDVGPRVATRSTVVDMSGDQPVVVRTGKGDPSYFPMPEEDEDA